MAEHDSNAILAEFLRRIDDGEQVDIDSVCEAHPEIAAELRSYVEGDEILAAMAGDDFEGDTSQPGAYDETVRPRGQGGTDIDLSGQKFGRYEVKRQLGQGAMGAVYLARDTQLDRDVALKIPKIGLVDKVEFIARFKREAQSAAKLNHPGICPVFDFGEVDGAPFITMAYVEGEPLSRFVGRKQVDNHWVADVVRKIAVALAHAHENGVIHRDLKSANVLVDRSGDPIVTDFGLAGRVDQDDEQTRITQVGAILGTPAYMSPEQIEGDSAQIGPPSDIYALGVILYELLAGELPFRGSMGSLIAQITRDEAKSPRKQNPDADQGLCELALKLLSKSPAKRPASMAEVAQQIDALTIGAAQSKPVDKKTRRKLAKLEAGKQRIEELVQRGQFAQAVSILEKMASVQDHDSAKYAKWAKGEIDRIKSLPKKLRDGAPHLLIAAQKLMVKHDYGQAAQVLQQIPANMRSPEARKLLEDAIELQDEADLLLTDLKDCVATRTYDGIEDNVQRLLELKPGNKFARELWEALETYQRIPRAQRNYRFDHDGQLQPRDEGLSKALLASIGVGVVVFAVMGWFMKGYLATESKEAGKITVVDNAQDISEKAASTTSGPAADANGTPPGRNRALLFAGSRTSADRVEIPTLVYDGSTPLTIEAWMKPFEPIRGAGMAVSLSEHVRGAKGSGIHLGVMPKAGGAPTWYTSCLSDQVSLPSLSSDVAAKSDHWTHVAVVRNGRQITLFVDGQQSGEQILTGDFVASPRSLQLGSVPHVEGGKVDQFWTFVGALDEVRISASPRYRSNFQPQQRLSADADTIALYHFDEGLGNVLVDASGNGHDGTIIGAKWVDRSAVEVADTASQTTVDNAEWTPLFNGRDFTGWQQYDGRPVGKGWDIRDDELRNQGDGNDIVTEQEYDNFELEFEWRMPEGGNSGVYYRVDSSLSEPRESAVEYQLFDDPGHAAWGDPLRRSGAIYNLYGKIVPLRPRDEFNRSRIVANGPHLTHYLNGTKIAEATVGSADWNRLSEAAKNGRFPRFGKPTKGRIAIQSHGSEVTIRNMRIRELDGPPQADTATVEPVTAERIYVDASANEGGDGVTWESAFRSLQNALAAAKRSNGAVKAIWLAEGTYRPGDANASRSVSFELVDGVDVIGGFQSGATAESQSNPTKFKTYLCGDLKGDSDGKMGRTINAWEDNVHRVVIAKDCTRGVELRGLVIRHGVCDGSQDEDKKGAGVYIRNSKLAMKSCVVTKNWCVKNGAAISTDSPGTFDDCSFVENFAFARAAIHSFGTKTGTLVYRNCLFKDNVGQPAAGAMWAFQGPKVVLANCRFLGNRHTYWNKDKDTGYCGGACVISYTGFELVNCLFAGNSARGHGGGLVCEGATGLITNCTFGENPSTEGKSPILLNSKSQVSMTNCIVWDNDSRVSIALRNEATAIVRSCCVRGGDSENGNIDVGPRFVGKDRGDFSLEEQSRCVDSGTSPPRDRYDIDRDGDFQEDIDVDINGRPRVFGGTVDIGAFEYHAPA